MIRTAALMVLCSLLAMPGAAAAQIVCPTEFRLESTDVSDQDYGWTGQLHDAFMGVGNVSVYDVTDCEMPEPGVCGVCNLSGPVG